MTDAPIEEFFDLIEDVTVCMLTSRDGGELRSRPMGFDVDKSTHEFHLLTRKSSHKADELAAHPEVNLSFARPGRKEYVSVSGQAYLTTDKRLIDAVWFDDAESWFPGGKEDPDVAVIRVVPSSGEYWEGFNALQRRWNLIKAKQAGEEPHLGENRKVAL
ncbi:pyridoxamine 5'-phosphate oxidase family protein [Afifella marina]|uniref:General stress protein 26 n=1 Tax=Afifella marina DSM 2698 TaxID=1120955 RepID=A0A1G5N640_AFIMA|nr:pyridoxamine 5'-phosphate oxidase family protein [Afifella marina]SCZ32624.1 General stress protein 26 [Afifella marina DSM 2698]